MNILTLSKSNTPKKLIEFLTQPQCYLTFQWIKPQMLLRSCLLHRGVVLPNYPIFCIFPSMSTSWPIYILFMWSVFFIIFTFITINHIISLTQESLFIGHVCQKLSLRVLLSFCLIFASFNLALVLKALRVVAQYWRKPLCRFIPQVVRYILGTGIGKVEQEQRRM